MATTDLLVGLASSFVDVVRPLEQSLTSADAFGALLLRLGWTPPSSPAYLARVQAIFDLTTDVQTLITQLDRILASPEPSIGDVESAITAATDLVEAIRA